MFIAIHVLHDDGDNQVMYSYDPELAVEQARYVQGEERLTFEIKGDIKKNFFENTKTLDHGVIDILRYLTEQAVKAEEDAEALRERNVQLQGQVEELTKLLGEKNQEYAQQKRGY